MGALRRPEQTRFPAAGELWLSRPPYTFLTRVCGVVAVGETMRIDYELLDDDGSVLTAVETELDASWWRNFQPIEPPERSAPC